jgi:outer membrane protein assembly factor BamB
MRCFLGLALTAALAAPARAADENVRIYSNPSPPPREVLDRLNLTQAWRAYVPVEDRRDGLFSVQMDRAGKRLFVQTLSGMVAVYDADTGSSLWRTRVGKPYQGHQPLAFNGRSVFVLSGTSLSALDASSGVTQWVYDVPPGVAAPPAADEELLYLCTGTGHVYAYVLPRQVARLTGKVDKADKPDADKKRGDGEGREYGSLNDQLHEADVANPAPVPFWDADVGLRLELKPLLTDSLVALPSPSGPLAAVLKHPTSSIGTTEVFRVDGPGTLGAPPGRFDELVFLGGLNGDVQAIDLGADGQMRWRYTGGSAVIRQPVAVDLEVARDRVDQDVYVVTERQGLARLSRDTGDPLWRVPRGRRMLSAVPEADRFLAANRKFVYANDRSGRLLVLDRARGTVLSTYDFHDFVFPVVNQTTDRLFLAANNGLIVCLHDKEFVRPASLRTAEEKPFDIRRLPPADFAIKEELGNKLALKVASLGVGDPVPLRRLLNDIESRYNLRIDIASDRTWREAKAEPPADKLVSYPKADKPEEQTLGDALQKVLDQINAHYVVHDRVYIVPGPPAGREAPPPPDKAPMDKDKKDK